MDGVRARGNGVIPALLGLLGLLPDGVLRFGARALFSRSWRRFEEATRDPARVQERHLLDLIAWAQDTEFGRAHGFAAIKSLAEYQARVPIRAWAELEPWVERVVAGEAGVLTPEAPSFFGRTSGTTGRAKHVPVTPLFLAEYRRPRFVFARQVMQAFPGLVRGKILMIHSPRIEGRTSGGVPYGSITVAYGGGTAGPADGPFDPAPRSLFLLESAELRYHALLRLALEADVRLAAAINPSTLVLLARKLAELAPVLADELERGAFSRAGELPPELRPLLLPRLSRRPDVARRLRAALEARGRVLPTDAWPNLLGLLSWKGGSAPFYLGQLADLFPGLRIMDWGYLATEGGFSIPLSPEAPGGVVAVTGHVLEFVEDAGTDRLEPHARGVLADALEPGGRYRVLVTGAHGLFRYDIHDVVECVGRHHRTGLIRFLHKGAQYLSVTGEKVSEDHVVRAAAEAEAELGLRLAGFSVSVRYADPPRYLLAVESDAGAAALEALCRAFDRALARVNLEYEAKRSSGRLAPPELLALPRGAYERDRDRRVRAGAPDAHVKPLHLVRDEAALLALSAPGEGA